MASEFSTDPNPYFSVDLQESKLVVSIIVHSVIPFEAALQKVEVSHQVVNCTSEDRSKSPGG